jgi:NAD(P)H-quinone oxidoreductase subunit 5
MPDLAQWTTILALVVPAAPVTLLLFVGLCSLVDRPLSERVLSRSVGAAILTGLLAASGVLLLMLAQGRQHLTVELGRWIFIPHFYFSAKLLFDLLSLPFVILSLVLCGTIAAFATKYLHREPGYNRFFNLYAIFAAGIVITALAGTIEMLFTGWELVGLSSALLVAFFHERAAPVRNGLRVWSVYRISDAGLLIAAVVLHHLSGEGDFEALMGGGPWPSHQTLLTANQALLVGGLLLVAAAGKSALVPFSGWLPRAMEGPTPSSAVFYGSLSVHLGAYLLLRVGPILEQSSLLCAAVVALGLFTAALSAATTRVQTDIKSALSYAALTQVGLIVAEIGLGLRWIALAHLIGHASLRTLQFLRAPMLLADYRVLENAIGQRLPTRPGFWSGFIPVRSADWLYRLAIERGYLDTGLNEFVARPFVRAFRTFDRLERAWTDLLSGRPSRDPQPPHAPPVSLEEYS